MNARLAGTEDMVAGMEIGDSCATTNVLFDHGLDTYNLLEKAQTILVISSLNHIFVHGILIVRR